MFQLVPESRVALQTWLDGAQPRPPEPARPLRFAAFAALIFGVIVYLATGKGRIEEPPPPPADSKLPIVAEAKPRPSNLTPETGKSETPSSPPPDIPKLADKPRLVVEMPSPSQPKVVETLITNTIGMKLKLIPAGEFEMGSDATDTDASDEKVNGKKHHVRITKPFYLGTTEVTVGQFRRFVEKAPYKTEGERDGTGGYGWNESKGTFEQDPKYTWRSPGFPQTDDHPVILVSWNDAVAFCDWLSKEEGRTYRLPTEAEWEHSCRAGQASRYWSGDDPETLAAVGNVADATAKEKYPAWTWAIKAPDGYVFTAPVGRFRPNGFGLYDMHGNVWEWCSDYYDSKYYSISPASDPQNSVQATERVNRGGSWSDSPQGARSASRDRYNSEDRGSHLGLRLARVQ